MIGYEETWFSIQMSSLNEDDWFETNDTYSSLQNAQKRLHQLQKEDLRYEWRIAKHVLTEEIITSEQLISA